MKVLGVRSLFRVRGTSDQRIGAIAAQQRGRVGREQLLQAGITSSMIETMLRNGRLYRRRQGVYAVGHAGATELSRETEVLLACPDGAVLSHASAAWLWGLLPEPRPGEPVHVTLHADHHIRPPGVRAHRSSALDAKDIRIHRGLPVTSPARTILDNASRLAELELAHALDEALHRRLVRLREIREVLTRAGAGRKGTHLLGALLSEREHGSGLTRSHAERRLRNLIRRAKLPEPELNVRLGDYILDMLWREHRLIVEVDSWEFHRGGVKFEADRLRDQILTAQGFVVLRFTARMIEREPYAVIARLAQALAWARTAAA